MSIEPNSPTDLTNCDREPIHIPGRIQPFGFLLAVSTDWIVSRASANIADFIGTSAEDALGQPIATIFCPDAVHAIRNRLTILRGGDMVERLFNLSLVEGRPPFDVAVHFASGGVLIEAEPAIVEETEAASVVRGLVGRLTQAEDLKGLFREGARQVRAITGFDRVMVYRFDSVGSGEVIAESVRPGIDSFLGLNYPASDIPAQARKLYLRNVFRVIADVDAEAPAIIPTLDARGEPIDLSLSLTRAVSPIHIEYLANMGVKASLSISIVVEGRLWGLFACHHYAPRLPSMTQRTIAELFGQMFSLMLESRERQSLGDYERKARDVADRLMTSLAEDGDLLTNAPWLGDVMSEAIPSDGAGVYVDGKVALSGLAPPREDFAAIVRSLNMLAASQIYSTDRIATILPGAEKYADRAAGLIAIPVSRRPRDYVVLFRAERLRAVRWAGNPEKTIDYGPNGPRLTPRKSFEEWSELVRGYALPFTDPEMRAAEMLRTTLLEVVLRMSDNAGQERAKAAERQELLIAELNHRVRNILALIRGLVSQGRATPMPTAAFIETLDDRIGSLARAHDQITADRWAPASLIDLIETEAAAYLSSNRERIRARGPNVLLEPTAFTTMALVLHELITNAAKYGALSDSGHVDVSWTVDEDGSLLLDWTEIGGPAVTAPSRRGFGSTIIERSIPYDLQGKAEAHYRLGGLEAHFCIPSRWVASVLADTARSRAKAPKPAVSEGLLNGRHVLLVEDSLIIALDGEDGLRSLGARAVTTASNVNEALSVIAANPPGFALLDFNLGVETSLPVADALAEAGIPFAFATGYGDQLDLPERHAAVLIVKKPYNLESLAAAIARVNLNGQS
ncbi:HWE histidine kinase domain-containing protein [Sphingomonas naphthae]|uniref:histidine kinase n=1 Tax=Sphingomonas naphthae TaxID=1813468 RepID=A0ABY7TN31_9SPHN|nr:HWE histidine kinase domain-containing protein [Sphingomonas naphthae]WCT74630.1 HWE histidine kinase domain-containing protein [Sphingomonas naphthae]